MLPTPTGAGIAEATQKVNAIVAYCRQKGQIMNIRKEFLTDLYDMVGDKGLYKETNNDFNKAAKLIDGCCDSLVAILCDIDREAFLRGAIAVLDIIAGKEEINEV